MLYTRMKSALPAVLLLTLVLALAIHGPIRLPSNYHAFADQRSLWGLANAADVLSNVCFLLAGAWAWWAALRLPASPQRWAWQVFALGVMAVSLGSAWYHLAPNDARITWDRLPIALACAGLSAALLGEHASKPLLRGHVPLLLLCLWATLSVFGVEHWAGDLRLYLLLQLLPILVLPVWLWVREAPASERIAILTAAVLYGLAKLAEWADGVILTATDVFSGHTLKHVLAAAACSVLAAMLWRRQRQTS